MVKYVFHDIKMCKNDKENYCNKNKYIFSVFMFGFLIWWIFSVFNFIFIWFFFSGSEQFDFFSDSEQFDFLSNSEFSLIDVNFNWYSHNKGKRDQIDISCSCIEHMSFSIFCFECNERKNLFDIRYNFHFYCPFLISE